MTSQILIDAIVRQTTVLIGQLATNAGTRTPLAHVAGRIFTELARELEAQGVSRKVSADMFGLALRTYQRRVRTFSESETLRGQSLWEAVLGYIQERRLASRTDILMRFHADHEAIVRAVLQDLTESGLVFRSGIGQRAVYRAASSEELGIMDASSDGDTLEAVLWVLIRREGPLTRSQLQAHCRLRPSDMERALERLVQMGRVRAENAGDDVTYRAESVVMESDGKRASHAGILDHFHAVVRTVLCRLNQEAEGRPNDGTVGGSTYTFQIWPGHPHERDVLGILKRYRNDIGSLRRRVDDYNAAARGPRERSRVTAYVGQSVIGEEENDANE